jgi:hypothetical protein
MIMKMEDRVARRFLKADYGDTHYYFNVFDYLEKADGSKMDPQEVNTAVELLESAKTSAFGAVDKAVQNALRKMVRKVEKAGFRLK